MHIRAHVLLLSACLALAAGPALAVTPNPTPNLKTGDYQAKWGILTVGNPTVYGRNNVSANVYPTTDRGSRTAGQFDNPTNHLIGGH